MHSSTIAEWILGRFTSETRATSIVGDLLELEPQNGVVWFWLSILRIVFALAWKRPVAFIAAFYAGFWPYIGLPMVHVGVLARHQPTKFWTTLVLLRLVGTLPWILSIYTTVLYGLRDRLTQIALVSAVCISTVFYFWWQPVILAASALSSLLSVMASILNSERRRAGFVFLVAVIIGDIVGPLSVFLAMQYASFIYFGPMSDGGMRDRPSATWVFFAALVITAWTSTSICSYLHRRLLESKTPDVAT